MDDQVYVAGANVSEPQSGATEKRRDSDNVFRLGRNWFVVFLSSEYVDPDEPQGGYVAVSPTGAAVEEPLLGANIDEPISGAFVADPLSKDAVVTISISGANVSEISTGAMVAERVTGAVELDELP